MYLFLIYNKKYIIDERNHSGTDHSSRSDTVKGFNFASLKVCNFYRSVFHDDLNFMDKPLQIVRVYPQILLTAVCDGFIFTIVNIIAKIQPKRIFPPLQYMGP